MKEIEKIDTSTLEVLAGMSEGMSIDERDGKCTWCICTSIYFGEVEG